MNDAGEAFTVTRKFRVTWRGVWLFAACLVFSVAGVALIVRGGAAVDTVLGVLAVLLFGGGGLLAASPMLSRRPVLVLDPAGVRVVAPWPRPVSDDLVVPWADIARIRAATQVVPHRGDTMLLHYLVFVPRDATDRALRPPVPWELSYAVRARPTWDRTIEEIVAEARRHRPDLVFEDRRLTRARPG
ncbi:hypothetical protein F4561_002981 [Lipingzhangella halophila]|uniref:PH domain-containing protein n=1 Tax=Lipingzhangella halophila TaxID=1783352 RepID=A0A7W7W2X0_9ACTN|nr:STM3941 family protein [Lipingzhangella halophila]MBB4932161.1 hypothetical protein [Lipingzhangella halophila]